MRAKVRITTSFREELIGDEMGSSNFYLRMTPVVKIENAESAKPTREDMKKIANAIMQELKKKGPIK